MLTMTTFILCLICFHRVYSLPGFLFSRPNWLHLPPHPQASVASPFHVGPRGGATLACGWGCKGTQFRRWGRNSGTLCIPKSARLSSSLPKTSKIFLLTEFYETFKQSETKNCSAHNYFWQLACKKLAALHETGRRCVQSLLPCF